MNLSIQDLIQMGMLSISFLTLILISVQLRSQNKSLKAQLLYARNDMYDRTQKPPSKEHLEFIKLYPSDCFNMKSFNEEYRFDEGRIKKYLYFERIYEYMAFAYNLDQLGVKDPCGFEPVIRWIKYLSNEQDFINICNMYQGYYPAFDKMLNKYLKLESK